MSIDSRLIFFVWIQFALLALVTAVAYFCIDAGTATASRVASGTFIASLTIGFALCFAANRLLVSKLRNLVLVLNKQAKDVLSSNSAHPALIEKQESSDLESLRDTLQHIAQSLAEARYKEQALLKNIADVICVMDTSLKFISVNASAPRSWGYSEIDLVGRSLSEFVSAEESELGLQLAAQSEKSIEQIVFETSFRRKDGRMIELLWSAHWSATEGGLYCVAHDITDRKIAERMLRESEHRVKSILEKLPLGVLSCSTDAILDFANNEAHKLLRLQGDLGPSTLISDFVPEIMVGGLQAFLEKIGNSATPIELQIKRSDNSLFDAELSISRQEANGANRVILIFADISERVEIERLQRELNSIVSHDLRTPLTSINIVLDLALEGSLGELNQVGQKLLGNAQKELNRLIHMINSLLDSERSRRGKLFAKLESVDLADLVVASINSVSHFANSRSITISFEDPQLKVLTDSHLFIQVLVNLLSNAVKFSIPGKTVEILAQRFDAFVRVEVQDSGRGVPADMRESIFERYKQAKKEDSENMQGRGLGLAICKRIIEENGGEIGVNERPAGGSIFWFTLPLGD